MLSIIAHFPQNRLFTPLYPTIVLVLYIALALEYRSSGNVFFSEPGGWRFISLAGQIEPRVSNGSPPLRHFFESKCVACRRNNAEMSPQTRHTPRHITASIMKETLQLPWLTLRIDRSSAQFPPCALDHWADGSLHRRPLSPLLASGHNRVVNADENTTIMQSFIDLS